MHDDLVVAINHNQIIIEMNLRKDRDVGAFICRLLRTAHPLGGVNGLGLVIGAGDFLQEVQHVYRYRILEQLFSRGGLIGRQEKVSPGFIGYRCERPQFWEFTS